MIKKMPIDEVKEGMFLGKPLMDSKGRMLVQKGVALKSDLIEKMKSWGLKVLFIEYEGEEEAESAFDPTPIIEYQKRKFAMVASNANMHVLQECATKHLIKNKRKL